MDWKFTVVTLVLFPSCLLPLRVYGKRTQRAVQSEQEDLGQMVVTMQETFAGIRVVKSFAREGHQETSFNRSTMLQFRNAMRIIKSMEAVGPLVETIAALGIGLALLYVYTSGLSAARFFALISGIFLLYEPIKTLSRIHIVMQRSISSTKGIFQILDSIPTVRDAPSAIELPHSKGLLEFRKRHVPLRGRRQRCGQGSEPSDRTREKLRAGRRERRGQEHHSFASLAPLRSYGRHGPN